MVRKSGVSRRQFLTQASYFGATCALAGALPGYAAARSLGNDSRIASTPVIDAGFASVRKIGDGTFATISDTSKGLTTMCNGGFVVGKDAALLVEGFVTANGAAFQMETLRKISQVPAAGALDTHYHFDHSCGNSFYGANHIPLWGHANVAGRMTESYLRMQTMNRAAILAPYQNRVKNASSELAKQHARAGIETVEGVLNIIQKTPLALPNRALDPATLPLNVDLGGYSVVIESYPGHSGTDVILRVPDQKVVFTGDLLFNGAFPATFDEQSTISGWRNTLRTFASFDKDTIFVPGHGPLCGQEGIARAQSVFDDIAEQAEQMYRAGIPAAEAGDRYVVPDQFQSLAMWSWDFCISPAVTKLYGEWTSR